VLRNKNYGVYLLKPNCLKRKNDPEDLLYDSDQSDYRRKRALDSSGEKTAIAKPLAKLAIGN